MKASAAQIRAALAKPPRDVRLFLLHGPDEAGAAALADLLAHAVGPDAERVDLDGTMLKADPARLADEAASLSLFGGARFVRAAPIGEESLGALTALLTAEVVGNPVVAIAPNLRASAKVVRLALESNAAMAHACYVPAGAEAERLATAMAAEHGLRIMPGIAAGLLDVSGGDRAVLAREFEKYALYLDAAPDRPRELDRAAVEAVGADLGESDTAEAVAALVEGRSAALGAELVRLAEGGASPIPWLRAIARRLVSLAEMRAAVASGETVAAVMKRHRVFYKEEAATERALRRWSPAMLDQALARLRAAERAILAPSNAGGVIADWAALALARAVGKRG